MNKVKQQIIRLYLLAKKLLDRLITLNNRKAKAKIRQIQARPAMLPANALSNEIFFLISLKIRTQNRQEILKTTLNQCLSLLPKDAGINFRVNDSSGDDFYFSNEQYFKNLPAANSTIQRTEVRLPGAYYQFLSQQPEAYCLTLFDDFPIVGLTESLLKNSCRLLQDFQGLVDLVLIESAAQYQVDYANQKIIIDPKLEFEEAGIEPLGFVKYGEDKFAIIENFHYGFFFSTSIVPAKDHARRLGWYLNNVSYNNPHKIELAGRLRRGPVYRYLAIPLGVYRLDLDFEHTEISIRPPVVQAKELYQALKLGYKLVEKAN